MSVNSLTVNGPLSITGPLTSTGGSSNILFNTNIYCPSPYSFNADQVSSPHFNFLPYIVWDPTVIDYNNSQEQHITLSANLTIAGMTNIPSGAFMYLVFKTNGHNVTWPPYVLFPGPSYTAPVLSSGANGAAVVIIYFAFNTIFANVLLY